ncbi:MAG TPA: hydrogenase maturation nickel metallochaperone HypA [Aggregatilineaceae bacterium]|nr:hydrogenase maturation nickel metallochaperone HypA [Aggregatilineaceae bacterium]
MHELSVTQSLLKLVLHHAEKSEAVRVRTINIVVGQLSSIVDDSIQFYWDMIADGTIAKGALLNFTRIPAKLHCNDCGHDFALNEQDYACPQCGGIKVIVTAGEEFYLDSIDVDLQEAVSN